MADIPGKFANPSGSQARPVLSISTHCLGSIHKIDSSITHLSMSSRSDYRCPLILYNMALTEFRQYMVSNQREDIDQAIFHFTQSILLSYPGRATFILPALFYLAYALVLRPAQNGPYQPEEVIHATKSLFYLRDQPYELSNIPRYKVTVLLVGALGLQVELEAGNVMQHIREIALLSRELLWMPRINLWTNLSSACERRGSIDRM